MNREHKLELRVGLLVVTATLLLVSGIIWGKELYRIFNKYQVTVRFDRVGGLMTGDRVMVNGVKSGLVQDVRLEGSSVRVVLEISDQVQLARDARFTIGSAELLTGMQVEIDPGSGEVLAVNGLPEFRGSYTGKIVDIGMVVGDLSRQLQALTVKLDTTVSAMNSLLSDSENLENLSGGLRSFRQTSDRLNRILREQSPAIGETVTRLHTLAGELNSLLRDNRGRIETTLEGTARMTAQLDSLGQKFNLLLDRLNSKNGLLAQASRDTMLYHELRRTVTGIDSLVARIQKTGLPVDVF